VVWRRLKRGCREFGSHVVLASAHGMFVAPVVIGHHCSSFRRKQSVLVQRTPYQRESRRSPVSCTELIRMASITDHAIFLPTLWHLYRDLLEAHPLTAKSTTSAILMLTSDLIAQRISQFPRSHQTHFSGSIDWPRAAKFAVLGGLFLAPISHVSRALFSNPHMFAAFCHDHQNAEISKSLQSNKALETVAVGFKVVADQLLLSPPLNALVLAYTELLSDRGQTIHATKSWNDAASDTAVRVLQSIAVQLPAVLKASWKVWPAAHLVTFSIVPLDLRVLYVNLVSLGWTTYLSLSLNDLHPKEGSATDLEF